MHRDMFKIQDGVAIVEKLNCRCLNTTLIMAANATIACPLYLLHSLEAKR